MTRHIDNVRRRDILKRFGLGALGLAVGSRTFDPTQIMYLSSMSQAGMGQGDLEKVEVLGTPPEKCQHHFKAHRKLIKPYGLTFTFTGLV